MERSGEDPAVGQSDVERATWGDIGRLLFEHAPTAVALLDVDGRFLDANEAMQSLVGRSVADLRSLRLPAVLAGADGGWPPPAELLDGRVESVSSSRRLLRPDGATFVGEVVLCAVRDEYRSTRRLVVQVSESSEAALPEPPDRAASDPLTGLANRSTMRTLLGHALRLPSSMGVLAVLHVDVRGLLVADGDGGPSRDVLLPAVAERLVEVVGSEGVVGRSGPDAFVVVLDEAGSAAAVEEMAAGLRSMVEGVAAILGVTRPTVRVGCDLPDRGLEDGSELGTAADAAFARARWAGRELQQRLGGALSDADRSGQDLVAALDDGGLGGAVTAWFQPVVELASRAVVGHEALARWRHPERGVLRPAQFMPEAENRGLTARVDEAVLDRACRHLAAGASLDRFVSVNLSLGFVLRPGLADRVRGPLARHSVPPGRLVLELTEAVVLQLTPSARRELVTLDEEGVRIFLDDFGAGYGALAVFDDLPVSGVKLDRQLVEASEHDERRARMLAALRHMVDALGIAGVVEGVETADEAERLQAMGWRHAQGYLFGSPMPVSAA